MKVLVVAAGIAALVAGFLLGSPLPAEARDRPAIEAGDPGTGPSGPCKDCRLVDERDPGAWMPPHISRLMLDDNRFLPAWAAFLNRLSLWSPVWLR